MALTMMCGLSFSGKTTFANGLAVELGASLISVDAINAERGLNGGQGIPLEEWAESNDIARQRAGVALDQNLHVVIDDTGSPRFIRDEWRETARQAGASFVIVWVRIDSGLQRERVLANRASMERDDIVDDVLDSHVTTFEPPTDEDPIVVESIDTRSHSRMREVARAISPQ